MTRSPRALLWVQHLLGSGHLRRGLAIAAALAEQGFETVLASGGPPLWSAAPGVRLVQLPSIRARDAEFSGLVDESGRAVSEALWMERCRRLSQLVDDLAPAVVITEMYPFGRRAFRDEVRTLLDAVAPHRALVVSSVRDVLVGKIKPERWAEMRDVALARFDRVLVHGDPAVCSFDLSFPHTSAIAHRLAYTGFVLGSPIPKRTGEDLAVVVSAGGGAVGYRLLAVALAARKLSRYGNRPWRLIGGANLPASALAELELGREPGVTLDRHRDDLPDLMATAEVSVSQAGYNTVAEGLAGAARLVLVPFDGGGQDEQRARATRLAEMGLATMLAPEALSPASLAAAIDSCALKARPDASGLAFDGAQRTATVIRAMLSSDGASG